MFQQTKHNKTDDSRVSTKYSYSRRSMEYHCVTGLYQTPLSLSMTTLYMMNIFIDHTFKDFITLTLVQWKTILEGMPDTILRAKVLYQPLKGPHELQYGTHYCSTAPSESTDYGLVVIGTDFNVPMNFIMKCVNHDTCLYRYRIHP